MWAMGIGDDARRRGEVDGLTGTMGIGPRTWWWRSENGETGPQGVESEQLETQDRAPSAIGLVIWSIHLLRSQYGEKKADGNSLAPTWIEKGEEEVEKNSESTLWKSKRASSSSSPSEMLRWGRGGSHVVFTLGSNFFNGR